MNNLWCSLRLCCVFMDDVTSDEFWSMQIYTQIQTNAAKMIA